jgi:hypothetical protein
LLIILFFFVSPVYTDDAIESVALEYKYYSLLLIVNFIAWIVAAKLMAYEYRKRLSEYWPHWMFWSLILTTEAIFFFFNLTLYVRLN